MLFRSPCGGQRNTADCVEKRNNARLIVEYGVAFFDRYLKSDAAPLGHLDGQGLRRYRREARTVPE